MRTRHRLNLTALGTTLPVILVALAGTAAAQAPAKAVASPPKPPLTQPKVGVDQPGVTPDLPPGASTFTLTLPSATARALTSAGGIELDQMRRNGLTLTVQGRGEVAVTIHTLRLEKGKVVERWSSPAKVTARTGTTMIPGDLLPPPGFKYSSRPSGAGGTAPKTFRTGAANFAPSDPWVPVAEAQRALAQGTMITFVDPKHLGAATGIVVVAVPACKGGDSGCLSSRTQAALAMPELFSDQ